MDFVDQEESDTFKQIGAQKAKYTKTSMKVLGFLT
jgi:hypothetical protein